MDYILKEHDMLETFNDFDILLPDDNFESKSGLDSSFIDSILNDGNLSQWPEVFPPLSDLRNFEDDLKIKPEDDVKIKTEVTFDDSPQSIIYSDSCSNSSDEKFNFETPPVSPPREEPPRVQFVEPIQKKTILKINPKNIKIIRNIKGLKPVGKQTRIVLPKDVLQKVMKIKSEDEKLSRPPSVAPIHPQISLGTPLILPNNRLQSPTISLSTSETASLKVEPLGPPISSTTFLKRDSIDPSLKNDLNLKALKRQQRMIKNRESACLSRKKKKEYVTALENRVSNLETENDQLKAENERLKARLKEIENNFGDFLKPNKFLNSSLRKTTALLAVLLMVSLNLGSLSLLSREHMNSELDGGPLLAPVPINKHGRALLWAQPELRETAENNTIPDRSTCPLHINQTESLRLEKELRRWIEVGENQFKNSTKLSRGLKPGAKFPPRIIPAHLKTLKKSYRWKGGMSALELYKPPFPGSLPRRDDTFYVFSFSSDHLLVPALAHDKTLRPKMSFLIPTVPLNDSAVVNGSVPMMQVDCEVLATKSVELTEEDFRIFKPKQESSGKNSSSMPDDGVKRNYRPYFIGDTEVNASKINRNFDGYLKGVYRTGSSMP